MRLGFRARLIASFAAVIVVTLLLANVLFYVVVQQIQKSERDESEQRLANVTYNVGQNLAKIRGLLSDYRTFLEQNAQTLNVRILLIDSNGSIQIDANPNNSSNLAGISVKDLPEIVQQSQKPTNSPPGNISLDDVDYLYYAVPGPCLSVSRPPATASNVLAAFSPLQQISNNPCTANGLPSNYLPTYLVLAVPQNTINANWKNFLQWLVLVAFVALIVAIAIAYIIARSIARPLIRMTRASEAIARGDYSQRLPIKPGEGDEIGVLSHSFNNMAQEVARSQQTMRDFVANVSHELKTPLTSIQGYSQAMLDGTADDPTMLEHSANVIYSEAARMRRLVDELLDLSRIEAGQIELNWREIDLPSLLVRVITRLEPLAAQKQIQLTVDMPPQIASSLFVKGDSDRLEQIFTNLLDNAIKYGSNDSIVNLTVLAQPPDKTATLGWAVVHISNTGPLIPPDQLPRIFERFYKLDKSRARKRGDSTGLGLAIVKQLVEAHHGLIQVDSRLLPNPIPDYGFAADGTPSLETNNNLTTFSVYLPLSQATTGNSASPSSERKSEEENRPTARHIFKV